MESEGKHQRVLNKNSRIIESIRNKKYNTTQQIKLNGQSKQREMLESSKQGNYQNMMELQQKLYNFISKARVQIPSHMQMNANSPDYNEPQKLSLQQQFKHFQPKQRRSNGSSRLLQNIIDGSNYKLVEIGGQYQRQPVLPSQSNLNIKRLLQMQQFNNQSGNRMEQNKMDSYTNIFSNTVKTNTNNTINSYSASNNNNSLIQDHKIIGGEQLRNFHKDFGHIDRLLKQSMDEPRNEQLRHHKISQLSSVHQHEQQGSQIHSSLNQKIYKKGNNNSCHSNKDSNTANPFKNPHYLQQEANQNKNVEHEVQVQANQQQLGGMENECSKEEEIQSDQQEQLQMLIQIDSSTSIPLHMSPYEDPTLVAKKFCYTNNIDPKVISALAKQIKSVQNRFKSKINTMNSSVCNNSTNNNKNSYYSSCSNVSAGYVQKENRNMSNIQTNSINNKNGMIVKNNLEKVRKYDGLCNRQKTQANTVDSHNNTKHNTNSKVSKNNTTLISNVENNYCQLYVPNIEAYDDNVFSRLYRNSQNKSKRKQLERNKQKHIQSQLQLRKYQNNMSKSNLIGGFANNSINNLSDYSNCNKQNIGLNQSSTFINNLSENDVTYNNVYQRNKTIPNNLSSVGAPQIKIYNKNVNLQKQSRLKNQTVKQQIQANKQKQFTGQPQINPLSRLIVQKIRQYNEIPLNDISKFSKYEETANNSNIKSSHIRLYEQKSKSKQKKIGKTINHIKKKQEQQMKQCTFHPKILNKSKCQKVNTDRFILLHQDYYIREKKAQTVKASQTSKAFQRRHPQINQVSKKLMKDKSFADRLIEYKINAQKNRQRIERQERGSQLHRPDINTNSRNDKRKNMCIGQYLYSKSLQKNQMKKQSKRQSFKVYLNNSSKNIYEEMKKNAFRYLFTLMDSDEDGLISSLKINILGLQTQILQLLAPLLCEMEQIQIQLDQQEFVQSIQRLFNTFSIHEKNLIINVYKNPQRKQSKTSNQHSFHPSLNQKSMQMARQIRDAGISLYEIGRQKQIERQSKLNELRALKALIQVQQCTFHPNLLYHH